MILARIRCEILSDNIISRPSEVNVPPDTDKDVPTLIPEFFMVKESTSFATIISTIAEDPSGRLRIGNNMPTPTVPKSRSMLGILSPEMVVSG